MSRLKTIRLPVSANLKLMLVLLALAIVAGTLWFTQSLVDELRVAERRTITFYANTLQALLNAPSDTDSTSDVVSELAYDVTGVLYFPVIVTTYPEGDIFDRMNVDIDTTIAIEEQEIELKELAADMAQSYEPLPIYIVYTSEEQVQVGDSVVMRTRSDTSISNYIYFDDSYAVKRLQLLPWIEIIIITMFILIAYISFSHIKRSEQSNIWVGMAKETAHQLGTPLSSLMGWIELLRLEPENREQVLEATDEMNRDVERLTTVAQRFSKIGSASQTKPVDMNEVIGGVVRYF